MLGMCVLTSGGDPATYADVLRRATASTPLALALLARLGAHLGCEPTNEAVGAARLERLRSRPDGLPAGAVARCADRGARRRRGLPAADHPVPPSSSARPACPSTASSASSRGSPRSATARPATTSSRTRSSRGSRPPSGEGAIAFKSVIAYRTGPRHHAARAPPMRAGRSCAGARTASARRARTRSPCATGCSSARSRSPPRARRAGAHPLGRRRPRQPRRRTRGPPASSTCSSATRSSPCC